MKKVLLICLVAVLSGCESKHEQLQKEIAQRKDNGRTIDGGDTDAYATRLAPGTVRRTVRKNQVYQEKTEGKLGACCRSIRPWGLNTFYCLQIASYKVYLDNSYESFKDKKKRLCQRTVSTTASDCKYDDN